MRNPFLTKTERKEMWAKHIVFCPQIGKLTTDEVSKIVSRKVFSAGGVFQKLLQERYAKLKENFRDVRHIDSKWTQRAGREICNVIPCACKPDARLAVPVSTIDSQCEKIVELYDEPSFGLDLPVWFYNGNFSKKTKRIMLVSQDPLRTDPLEGFLYISSPWAFHSCDFRALEQNAVSSLLVDYLLSQGYCLYLSDAAKIFAGDHDFAANRIQPTFRNVFLAALRDEIRLFMPDVIVAVGEPASRIVLELGGKTPIANWAVNVIPYPLAKNLNVHGKKIPCISVFHFSRISSNRKCLMGCSEYSFTDNAGNQNYVQYYARAIESACR